MLVFIAISFLSAFIMIKIAKNKQDFKTLIAQYGGLLVPFTLLHAISLIGGMISSLTLTFIPLFISLILSITFLPVIFVYEKVAIVRPNNQKVYLSLATVIVMSILFYIVGEAFLMNMIEEFERFDMYW